MPSWEKTFLKMARVMSERTHCTKLMVGAVLATHDNQVVAAGYNGPARGDVHCDKVGCLKKTSDVCRGSHAEDNVISSAASVGASIRGCTLYCTHRPCMACAKKIVNAQIRKIVYEHDYEKDLDVFDLFSNVGVALVKWDVENDHQVPKDKLVPMSVVEQLLAQQRPKRGRKPAAKQEVVRPWKNSRKKGARK